MTMIRTSVVAALGLLALGAFGQAKAGPLAAARPAIATGAAEGLHLATERGSWIEPGRHWERRGDRRGDRHYGDYDDHHRGKHFKNKRFVFERGYERGYDEGYYDARRRSFYERRHHHRHYYPDYGFRSGFYFGDGHFGGGSFHFRY